MDIPSFFGPDLVTQLVRLVFIVLSSIFILGYFVYAVIFFQRLRKLNKTYTSSDNAILFSLSWLQFAIGSILLLYALLQLW
ncbi:MAG: hypothetical protein NUV52_00730 [Candidatus Roizmanbacteria bacterium]|nr:hypothetical protein [Candidatus Roizmanbacteria bacterium]